MGYIINSGESSHTRREKEKHQQLFTKSRC